MSADQRAHVTRPKENTEVEERFRILAESVRDYAIFILDPDGFVTTWNLGAERINGYRADEIIGKHFSVFYSPAEVAAGKCERELETAAREGRLEEEGWRLRKDGSRLWASVTITALRNPDGTLVGFAKVTGDLTERRKAEEATQRFRLLVESVKDYAIFILTPEGIVSTWNLGAERIKGYRAQEIIGKHFSVFYPPADIAAGKCEYELEAAARDGRFEDEGWRLRKDGSLMWANVIITALRNPEGALVGFAKVTRDLSERRATEEKLRDLAAEKAALAEKARTHEFQERFLGILGHDLRNPLASIDMGAGIVRQKTDDPALIRVVDRMQISARRMSRMIEQILDLTRSRLAGGLKVDVEPMDLCKTLNTIAEELRLAHPSRIIEVHCPPLTGAWDRDRLEQVFSNLIGNALAHGDPEAPVTIDARVVGEGVQVDVHNEGPPIPEELQPTLFDPFRRGEREGHGAKASGLGLGLYISKELVLAHGGTLDLRSGPGEGTTFRVILPGESVDAPRRPDGR